MKKTIVVVLIVIVSLFLLNKPFRSPQPKQVEIKQQIGLPNSAVDVLRNLVNP